MSTVRADNQQVIKQEERQKEKFIKQYKEVGIVVVGVVSLIVAVLNGLNSNIYSREKKVETVSPIVDNVARLNQSFYSSQIQSNPFIVTNEFSDLFTNTLKSMQRCELSMRGFYGESGIGKTTMLKESLRLLEPFPYLLVSLSKTTTIKELAKLMNLVVDDEARWSDIQLAINQFIALAHQNQKGQCPILIIDNANRNRKITEQFIDMVRENTERQVGLLIVISDGYYTGLDTAGGRLWTTELLEPSHEFGVKYLNKLNLTNNDTITRVLDITGTKAVYLGYARYCLKSNGGRMDFRCLETIIDQLITRTIALLPNKIREIIMTKAAELIKDPNGNHTLPQYITEETEKMIYRSNILRQGSAFKSVVIFQNKTVKRYFEKIFK
ncbi:predicted protein [Naegleria gruberi]|uniref:Predicted protein n=1 Tax=Naegleria gruberi TaxID=5762 RepID=D2W106_NAEGR|nr:uncharacterized protein NAEGRDRAFT_53861 [Naegleria gruberi]EFC37273.1 predicted protein [Naegleria gruberi]|eukprot:XP_002670017.1 predicted protein [Naegleria gruberi strain NEG-M]